MFTAIVLVCAGEFKTPQDCYTYTNEKLFATQKMCFHYVWDMIKNCFKTYLRLLVA